jgi:hypothetical protein
MRASIVLLGYSSWTLARFGKTVQRQYCSQSPINSTEPKPNTGGENIPGRFHYLVLAYSDYRKEVNIQPLKIFSTKDAALAFVKKYCSSKSLEPEYVGVVPNGSLEFDAQLGSADRDDEGDDATEEMVDKRDDEEKQYEKELGLDQSMWYTRLAVCKVPAADE